MRKFATFSFVAGFILATGCATLTPKRQCFLVLSEATATMQAEAIFFTSPAGAALLQANSTDRPALTQAADALHVAYLTARPICQQGANFDAAGKALANAISGVQAFLPPATVSQIKAETQQ